MPTRHNRLGEVELTVEFQRARLDGQRARCRARSVGLVDDPHGHALPAEPESEHQAGRSGPRDQHLGRSDLARILQMTLDEEGEADKKLTRLAESGINQMANA